MFIFYHLCYHLCEHSKASRRIDSIRLLLSNFAAAFVCSRSVDRLCRPTTRWRTSPPEFHQRSWWIVHTRPTKRLANVPFRIPPTQLVGFLEFGHIKYVSH